MNIVSKYHCRFVKGRSTVDAIHGLSYSQSRVRIVTREGGTAEFIISKGIGQGDALSTTLFNAFLEDLTPICTDTYNMYKHFVFVTLIMLSITMLNKVEHNMYTPLL